MNINLLNNENILIKKILSISNKYDKKLIKGIGDDAAIIKLNKNFNKHLIVTTDTLVENTHFKRKWSSAKHIGIKAAECNISDIASMGGTPHFMFISLSLPNKILFSWVEEIYEGLKESCDKYGIIIAGGDTTKGNYCTINITLIGKTKKPSLRSHAKVGDIIALTGYLGNSAVGLKAIYSNLKLSNYLIKKHITPKSKSYEAIIINSSANAIIDISDGLSSEIYQICNNSKTGAIIYNDKLPTHKDIKPVTKKKYSKYIINGGEDLELLFTITPSKIKTLKKSGVKFYIIGIITSITNKKILINNKTQKKIIPKGFDHFLNS